MSKNISNLARDLRDQAGESMDNAKHKMVEVGKNTAIKMDDQAHKKPWYFVGFAAFFSSLFGFFLGRKTKR